MKKQMNFNFTKMSKEQTIELTTTVHETVAKDFITAKSFTIVDLWNIRRNNKTTTNTRKSALIY